MTGHQPYESRYFHYAGRIPIHYQVAGHGPDPLIFLHGFASAHSTWHDMAGFFPMDRFRLFLLDLKGFGLSSKPKDGAYSVEDQSDVVRDFIRELGLRSVTIIGHSLGGAVALRIVLQELQGDAPFAVSRLVLIGCAAYPQRLPKFFQRLKMPLLGPVLFRLIPARTMVRRTLERVFFDAKAVTPERFERYRSYLRGKGVPHVLRATVKGIDPEVYARIGESYRKIAIPTLIIWGEEDRIIKLQNGVRLHGDIPGSRLKVVAKCGHNPHEERPGDTFDAINAFLTPAPQPME